ncbi:MULTISPECIES: hypothetical protein [Pseudomonas]|uniref:Uncharacterized protein n=4 Tax=Pseudomonas syringae group TaxID=136849 RepID=A0A0P9VZ21_PSESS|nr:MULTISPECIES: hypothetical protein [Pseudomonas]KAA3547916.1 hypothetical protein DXU85_02815 [Pseudomonas savastanoi]KPW88911.1 Uncharacterized protein ALO79_04878 [Pseudomonas syringae pv. castaneae]KPX27541.1 hypothetical protein ALO70_200042 [Pseudomonas amygdali pv. eriobotryae]KPX97196.1 hypothetical protein ALO61_200144 [Pseudomonas savastanoi pv. nerii]KPY49466.1 Uncharacterized protein ALO49_05123 [Pseudomonas savastanoi pv. retacarpa]
MNVDKIEISAKNLEDKLKEYVDRDVQVARLYDDLRPLLELAKSRNILSPLEVGEVPGRYRFTEKGLQRYSDLEHAYAVFSIEITGGEPPILKMLNARRNLS